MTMTAYEIEVTGGRSLHRQVGESQKGMQSNVYREARCKGSGTVSVTPEHCLVNAATWSLGEAQPMNWCIEC